MIQPRGFPANSWAALTAFSSDLISSDASPSSRLSVKVPNDFAGQQVEGRKFRTAQVGGGTAIVGRSHPDTGHQFRVLQAGTDARFDLVQRQVGGHHQRQAVDVTVVDDLEEFFLRPGGGILRAEIVQHQKLGSSDLFEALFEGGVIAVIGEAQGVEQVGDSEEKGRHAHLHGIVGNGGRQVGLAAAIAAHAAAASR